ncbi:MAG TPA: hypothetical protein VGY32_09605 [Solirubrobacteraceae bacterium]|jgi:hypothetical protein|nr:hypothetical protein [Solirubrobacteraceae bacterium]
MLVCGALLCAFGPHLVMLGYQAAGGRAPGALSFFCLLNHSSGVSKPAPVANWSIQPATARR